MISKSYVKSLAKRNPARARYLACRMLDGFHRAALADTNPGKRDKANQAIWAWWVLTNTL